MLQYSILHNINYSTNKTFYVEGPFLAYLGINRCCMFLRDSHAYGPKTELELLWCTKIDKGDSRMPLYPVKMSCKI